MGAVPHALSLRLVPEQLAYVIDHAQDKMVIVDAKVLRQQCAEDQLEVVRR